ncbi:glycosyltransferase [Methanoregula sp.]|uniref:glycosyltransferase n=1 Tax=Methanoregula sp. TaxID=2052170 RepID=UPI003C72AD9E
MPCYLEEENLRLLLPRLVHELKLTGDPFEILIIDTMQVMDNTKEVCEANGAIYISRHGGNNYGDAIRTGVARVQGEYTIFMDADGSHSPEFINNLYRHRNEYDIVIASRYIEGGSTDNTWLLILMSYITNLTYAVILNLQYKDISNSFKLYKTAWLKELTLRCKNFDIVEEILYKIKKNHKELTVLEIPYSFKQRLFGHTKRNLFVFILTYIVTIIRLRFDF